MIVLIHFIVWVIFTHQGVVNRASETISSGWELKLDNLAGEGF